MAGLSTLFSRTASNSRLLINIDVDSVSAAFALFGQGSVPKVIFSTELSYVTREGIPLETAMLGALEQLLATLLTQGAPALARATGSGTTEGILISVGAPWQTTAMVTPKMEPGHKFVFTKGLVAQALSQVAAPQGEVLVDESAVGTILDGYETRMPYGKMPSQAMSIILVSSVNASIAEGIGALIAKYFHTKNARFIAGPSARYQAVHAVFPFERDCLILDATGPEVSFALVRRGLLVAMHSARALEGDAQWIASMRDGLAAIAQDYPLPHVVFLLTRNAEAEKRTAAILAADLGRLWLTDNAPKIIALSEAHLSSFLTVQTTEPASLSLRLLVLYAQLQFSE